MLISKGETACAPAAVGYDAARLDVLNDHLAGLVSGGKIQCATYCIARRGKIIAHNGIGRQSYRAEDMREVPHDAIQYIASITKIFTATAIMKLVEDGKLRLDQPVADILPQFKKPPFAAISIFHLLTHTSGMHPDGGCFPDEPAVSQWALIGHAYLQHKEGDFDWIEASLENGVRMAPGKEWAYCSFGFCILGAVIAKITGMRAEAYIENFIAKPLGLLDTSFSIDKAKAARWIVHNEELYNAIHHEQTPEAPWDGIPSTGGGLNSTAYDLLRFGQCIMNKGTLDGVRILGKKAVEKMITPAIHNVPDYCWSANTPSRGFGIGFDMRNGPAFTFSADTFNHEGAGACALYADPTEELVAAWIVPFADSDWHPEALWNVQNIIWSGVIE
ncbi:MAG: serine hydrolase domain-containing protein [Oscillospiraceae bacterium]